ncbi:transcription termination/antitermination NusG family protein [Sinorhizobium medicae]|uniref:transcription termination/antitermination NusG family protein n=1 Tax=Sinorhizobium medicae TaxID=110321 RepID=UPI000C7DB6A0|nr:transcription termination/antitermination NusG family protein [Sinorhizobium medicae]MDX0425159.1 antitermination protein NusG [Sinorhizobium medicae]MDX0430472.1 antitermination protein NusG [Sinorhizobium medicae]MDX0438132.1 antitermination protein NusG [Sinorhizobium medicae]MDX0597796.1 antitermination protein NusG [Sinorhizobium medicae]MDX0616275.1 antitermination protein NusG [Sinorhizobium medicae]
MIMQRSTFTGSPIALQGHDRFADRMRRITDGLLDEGALLTANLRISGGRAPWFALRVWTGREKTVEKSLDAMGVRSLVPMRKGPDLRRRHRVVPGQMMPVIHGYVLVQMVAQAEYLAGLLGVEHVIDVLGGCDRPMRLSDKEVSRFSGLARSGDYDWERPVALQVRAGEAVLITAGPFCDRKATVVTPSKKGRGDVVVSIDFMGGEVPVIVPLALLKKL